MMGGKARKGRVGGGGGVGARNYENRWQTEHNGPARKEAEKIEDDSN